jgi:4-cresol dehydrogenase (hydroxylating)
MQGVPTDVPWENIGWRETEPENMGLIWFAPTSGSTQAEVSKVLSICHKLFDTFAFEMPVTITAVSPRRLIYVFSIHFNLSNEQQTKAAHELYSLLLKECFDAGFLPYRQSVLGMSEKLDYYSSERGEQLEGIKRLFDPDNIISRGRYGLG